MHLWAFRFDPSPCAKLSDPSEIIIIPNGTGEWKYSDRYDSYHLQFGKLIHPHCLSPVRGHIATIPIGNQPFCVFLSQLYVCSPVIKQWISQPQSPPLRTIKAATDVETSAATSHTAGWLRLASRFDWRLFQCISFVFFCSGKIN